MLKTEAKNTRSPTSSPPPRGNCWEQFGVLTSSQRWTHTKKLFCSELFALNNVSFHVGKSTSAV